MKKSGTATDFAGRVKNRQNRLATDNERQTGPAFKINEERGHT
jgi:hypothetical protein